MLSTMIGVVLAFITVLLLLSLVVTGLVQATQSVLRLRARNLQYGVESFLKNVVDAGLCAPGPKLQIPLIYRREATKHAAQVLNDATPVSLLRSRNPNSPSRRVLGPKVSWVEPNRLATQLIQKYPDLTNSAGSLPTNEDQPTPSAHEKLIQHFRAYEPVISDRFAFVIRLWTIAWSLVVAVAFQVSVPDLLKSLSTADAKRDAIIAVVPTVLKQTEFVTTSSIGGDFVDQMLGRLTLEFPNREVLFQQVSGNTDSKDDMVAELRAVLAQDPARDRIAKRYAEIIDSATSQNMETAVATTTGALNTLDTFGIGLWGKGNAFYCSSLSGIQWRNIAGVLLTAILLSFGAPFWFEQLKNVARLRDAVTPSNGSAK